MEEYKISYNYKTSEIYENQDYWLIGCKIVKAETYSEAQEIFKKNNPCDYEIRDIELLN